MEEQKIKVGDPVTREIVDLIAGLKDMGDLDGLYFKLERLESLSNQIDETVPGGDTVGGWHKEVADAAHWQRSIISEIRAALNTQGRMIRKLQGKFDTPDEQSFVVDPVKCEAIIGLHNLFCAGELIGEQVNPQELRAWSRTYGVDFDQVVSILTPKPDLRLRTAV